MPGCEPTVSVIVPVLNASSTLTDLFEALRRLDPLPDEILLVDNGSTDGSLELLRAFTRSETRLRARVLVEGKRGAAAARNGGIQAASGDILAFTDSDCRPAENWLAHIVRPFSDASVGAVAGSVEGAPASTPLGLLGCLYTLRLPTLPRRHDHWSPASGGFPTANLAVRREVALGLGGFDEQVEIYGEDYDFCARLYARGLAIDYEPRARVAHHHRTRLKAMVKQAFGFGRSHAYLLRRHGCSLLWVELPGRTLSWKASPFPIWLDLAGADKKVLALAALGTLYAPLWLLLPAYLAHLADSTRRRAIQSGTSPTPSAIVELAALLLLKSAALAAGRWWGSWRYKCLCL